MEKVEESIVYRYLVEVHLIDDGELIDREWWYAFSMKERTKNQIASGITRLVYQTPYHLALDLITLQVLSEEIVPERERTTYFKNGEMVCTLKRLEYPPLSRR